MTEMQAKAASKKPHEALALCFLPWLVFAGMIFLFYLPPDLEPLTWVLVTICGVLSLLFVVVGYMGGGMVPLALGVLCVAAIGVSLPVGLTLRGAYMHEYWRLDGGQNYRDVEPVESSSTKTDATMLEFKSGASVDTQKSVGYMRAGQVYCVAPIIGSATQSDPSFWAAGMNCCGDRTDFKCGSSDDSDARAMVVYADDNGHFAKAVRMATSVYGITAVERAIAGYWVKSLDDYKDGLAWGAGLWAAGVIFGHLVSSIAAGIFVVRRLPVKKY